MFVILTNRAYSALLERMKEMADSGANLTAAVAALQASVASLETRIANQPAAGVDPAVVDAATTAVQGTTALVDTLVQPAASK